MRRPASQLHVGIAIFDVATRRLCLVLSTNLALYKFLFVFVCINNLPVVNAVTRSLKSTARSRAVRI